MAILQRNQHQSFWSRPEATAISSSGSTMPVAGVPSSPAPPQAGPSEKRVLEQETELTGAPAESQKGARSIQHRQRQRTAAAAAEPVTVVVIPKSVWWMCARSSQETQRQRVFLRVGPWT